MDNKKVNQLIGEHIRELLEREWTPKEIEFYSLMTEYEKTMGINCDWQQKLTYEYHHIYSINI